MESQKPTFLLLRARLPAKDVKKLLGRFVTHPARPLDNSEPDDPASIISNAPTEIIERSATNQLSSIKNAIAHLKAQELIELQVSANDSTKTDIENTTIKTYRLNDHYKAFDKLMEDPTLKTSLQGQKGLFSRSRGKLFWVVGIKTCSAGTSFSVQNDGGKNLVASLTVPLSKAFAAPAITDPQLGLSGSNGHVNFRSFDTVGEQVFAVEYKAVRQRNIFGLYSESAESRVDHNVTAQRWGNAVFSNKREEGDIDDAAFDDELNERQALELEQAGPAVNSDELGFCLDEDDVNFDGHPDVEQLLI